MNKSGISYVDYNWNWVRGCEEASPGCKFCYARDLAARFSGPDIHGPGKPGWGHGFAKMVGGRSLWTGRVSVLPEMLDKPLRGRKNGRVFVNSASDTFHPDVPFESIAASLGVMSLCPDLDFLILTKRAERMAEFYRWLTWDSDGNHRDPRQSVESHACAALSETDEKWDALSDRFWNQLGGSVEFRPWPLPNVWLLVTAEDQKRADERILHLLECPSVVHGVSYEPALEAVNFSPWLIPSGAPGHCFDIDGDWWHEPGSCRHCSPTLDWVICGGESGSEARPFFLNWARSVRDQCNEAGTAFYMKQAGSKAFDCFGSPPDPYRVSLKNRSGSDPSEWPEDLRVREYPEAAK